MNVAVIGLGSMGRRRIRLLKEHVKQVSVIGIDVSEERKKRAEEEWGINTYSLLNNAISQETIEVAFISASPLSHSKLIQECLENNLHVFTEINLVDTGYDMNLALAKKKNLTLFLSSTFMYRDEIDYICSSVKSTNHKLNYSYHTGQYLPDWHPWENYKDFFVGDKRTNGCREILAIELPWITAVFGRIKEVHVLKDKITDLEISYPDNYIMLLLHETGHKGTLSVNVVSRKAVRNLEIYGESLYLQWDGSPEGLFRYDYMNKINQQIEVYQIIDKLESYSSSIIENAYLKEIINFMQVIDGKEKPRYTMEEDKLTLKWIDRIEGC